jgi:hypothetical protein
MDSVKLDGRSTIGILDPTRVSQTSHNVILKKESEMYKDMTMTAFNKEISRMRKEAWSRVALLRQLMLSWMEARKSSSSHIFLSKFHLYF